MASITSLPANKRFHSKIDWLESFHIFNFANNYMEGRNGFGDLLVVNDDYIKPASGFGMHPHRDMEIVTWVISGSLTHEDNGGNVGNISPGEIQQMSAGSGVLHSEYNHSPDEEVHLLQMWLLPDKKRVPPRYQQENVEHLIKNQFGCIASGAVDAPIHLHNETASLYVGRFDSQTQLDLPTNEKLYVYIAKGSMKIDDEDFNSGDSILIENANSVLSSEINADSEIIVWSIDSHARESSQFRD